LIRLAIVVEGDTESEFVKLILTDHLRTAGVEPYPFLLNGNVTIERVASSISNLIWNFDCVSSLVDYYGFRDKGNLTVEELETSIDNLVNERMRRSWDESTAFSYVQRYEFDGLLFSNVNVFEQLPYSPRDSVEELRRIRASFMTPEHINDSPDTAPSKRIKAIAPRFHKRTDGPLLAAEIGLETMRAECKRFDAWLTRLENL